MRGSEPDIKKFPTGAKTKISRGVPAGQRGKMFPMGDWSSAMQRRHFRSVLSFPDQLSQEAERLRAEAERLPQGMERRELERKARQVKSAAHMDAWLRSPGLQPPK